MLVPLWLSAQDDCPCCTDNHKQFDFWVGSWIVTDTLGNFIGENEIIKLEDGCILSEKWTGSKGGTGRSYNYYDNSDSTWNQLWIDNSGRVLKLKGKYIDNEMVLQSQLHKGTKIDYYKNQITWTPNPNNTVTQKWEILDKDNSVLQLIFLGIYNIKQ